MLEKKDVCDLVAQLGTAAAMLLEDRHLQLVTRPRDLPAAAGVAVALKTLGVDIAALRAAAAVLLNQAENQEDQAG